MNKEIYITSIIKYIKQNASIEEVISFFRQYTDQHSHSTSSIASIHIKSCKDEIGVTAEEADLIVKGVLYDLLFDSLITADNAQQYGYTWENDAIYPAEAPNELIVQFFENLEMNGYKIGTAAGSSSNNRVGIYKQL